MRESTGAARRRTGEASRHSRSRRRVFMEEEEGDA
jgi:hypothetical protein